MAYYPLATEFNAHYRLVGADGVSVASFNDPTDPNYVGVLTEVTGLDSAEIRESASDMTEADGGSHGAFYLGRRPITLTGRVFGHATVAERSLRLDRARRASLALRGDSLLYWKPSRRVENLVQNPSWEIDTSWWGPRAGGTTNGRATDQARSGVASYSFVNLTAGDVSGGNVYATTPIMPISPGQRLAVGAYWRSTAAISPRVEVYFNTGTGDDRAAGISSYDTAIPANAWTPTNPNMVVTAPANAKTFSVRFWVSGGGLTLGSTAWIDDIWIVQVAPGAANPGYFDGNTPGYYWAGNPHASTSGDFIEMFVPVRRQGPFRETEAWNKAFQIPLVSEYAYIFGSQIKTVAAGVAAENRGNIPAYPILTITGASADPTVSDGTRIFRTTGLSGGAALAAGESVEFDMLTHTGKFTAGARNGQSANRFINWATTAWPYLTGLGTTQTFTLTGGGTLSVRYRDAWA